MYLTPGLKSVSQSVSLVLSKLRIRYKGDHKFRRAAARREQGKDLLDPARPGAQDARLAGARPARCARGW